MVVFEKLQQFKEMNTELVVNWNWIISKVITRWQALDTNPKSMQEINFKENLGRDGNENTTAVFMIEEAKKTVLDFSQATIKVF